MKLKCEFKENEALEIVLRNFYSEHFCEIVIEWIEEALKYVFKETEVSNVFLLGRIIEDINGNIKIEYSDETLNCIDIISLVIDEMECALEDEGNESREHIENELRLLSNAL